ncbi:MAG: hypothetical protein NWE81_02110, partial [Candidatus Bathyarchaeota archaeon]|nr:hypothetical protein [Candidatus Bathyarchaeota archaeon]
NYKYIRRRVVKLGWRTMRGTLSGISKCLENSFFRVSLLFMLRRYGIRPSSRRAVLAFYCS